MKFQYLATVVVLAATLSLSAQAQIYVLTASAKVETLEGVPPQPSLGLGAFLSIELRYDLSIPGVKSSLFPGHMETLYTPFSNNLAIGSSTFALRDYTQSTAARLYANNGYFTFGHEEASGVSAQLFLLSSHLSLFDQVPDESQSIAVFDYQAEILIAGRGWNGSGRVTSFSITEVEGPTAVPEPSTYGALGCVLLAGLVLRRRRKSLAIVS